MRDHERNASHIGFRLAALALSGALSVSWAVTGAAAETAPADEGAEGSSSAEHGLARLEGGARVGIGIPVGKAGKGKDGGSETRELGDLAPLRAPLWLDLGYRLSESTTLGLYAQVGVGSSGDACRGVCNWADLRLGAQAAFRFAPGANLDPWLGVGVGYESFTFRTLHILELQNPETGETTPLAGRSGERLGGPELVLQGGLDFELEPALRVGPYASASLGLYTRDGIKCTIDELGCPDGSSIDGSGVHSWLSIGLRGSYAP